MTRGGVVSRAFRSGDINPFTSCVQIKHKIYKNMNSVLQQREHRH